MTFKPGKRYLCWNTESVDWTLHMENSNELIELKCLAITKQGSIKFQYVNSGYIVWMSSRHPFKIKEQL